MILVTGAAGFIGRHLVEALKLDGYPVRCLVRTKAKANLFQPPVETCIGDLLASSTLAQILRDTNWVFHLAGVTRSFSKAGYLEGNHTATQSLLSAMRTLPHPPRIVYLSSLAAAGPSADGKPIDESHPPRPVSHYGRSKLLAEQAIQASGFQYTIIRPPVVYGPLDRGVDSVLSLAMHGVYPVIPGALKAFSLIYVQDLVKALMTLLRAAPQESRTYFVSHSVSYTAKELCTNLSQLLSRPVRRIPVPFPAAKAGAIMTCMFRRILRQSAPFFNPDKIREWQQPYWLCDPKRFIQDIGQIPCTPLVQGLSESLKYFRQTLMR